MKAYYLLIAALLATGATCPVEAGRKSTPFNADISKESKPATIKVLLAKGADKALLEVKGSCYIYTPSNGIQVASEKSPKRDYVLIEKKGMKWGEVYPGIFEMRIVPANSQTTLLVNGIQYRGCIEIYAKNDKLNIVNEVDIESYLKATLTTQFTEEMDEEVMEAVAIVVRTNATYLAAKNPGAFWHVNAKQVNYFGYGAVLQNLQVDKAVEASRHTILTYNKAPFAAVWTKDSAGKTALYQTMYRKDFPSPKGVEAVPAARDRDKHRWTFSISREELASLIGLRGISAVDLFQDKESNKVYGIKIHDQTQTQGQVQTFDFLTLQKKIGTEKLRSSDFTVTLKGNTLVFTGYGEGPGVGLCLYSAHKMAEQGEKAKKILTTFFPETELDKVR